MEGFEKVLAALPSQLALEIKNAVQLQRRRIPEELRLRAYGASSALVLGERIPLLTSLDTSVLSNIASSLVQGALYAHRESLEEGYISLASGVRVGVFGQARYDGGRLVGVSGVTSLVFRIPTEPRTAYAELYPAFLRSVHGMLIYSSPGVGKTSALRSLVGILGRASPSLQVAVVDERREFLPEDYRGASVDVLQGYKKDLGMEIALRTAAPDVIAVDEIGSEREAMLMVSSLSSGVRFLASAHAGTLEELLSRPILRPFFSLRAFDVFCRIEREGSRRRVFIDTIDTALAVQRKNGVAI